MGYKQDLQGYFEHYAEVIAQAQGETAQCTIVEIRGTDCLYEVNDENGTWRGWLRDGETIRDIEWRDWNPD